MILSILEAGIFVKDETSKIDDVLMEHGGLQDYPISFLLLSTWNFWVDK